MRKIMRNVMKNKVGGNQIKYLWRRYQLKKWGERAWCDMYRKCVGILYESGGFRNFKKNFRKSF